MKKISIFILCNILLIVFMPTSTNANAHETTLDVVYDNSLPKDYVNSSNILNNSNRTQR